MKTIETNSVGVKFNVTGVPDSFGELLEIGQKQGLSEQQLLDKVIGFFVAHVVNEDGRDLVREKGPDAVGVPFKTKTVKKEGEEATEIDDETVGVWAKRAAADKGTDLAGLGALLQSTFATDKLEFSVGGVRKGGKGGNKAGKEVLAQAQAAIDSGTSTSVIALLQKRHPDLVFTFHPEGTVLQKVVKDDNGAVVKVKDAEDKEVDKTEPVDVSGQVTVESLAAAIRTNKIRREQEDAALLGLK